MKTPIALFAFKRPLEIMQTLYTLSKNRGIEGHPVYIYCDGARNASEAPAVEETRKVIKANPLASGARIIFQDRNKGLANSIIDGATELCNRYGQVIILEDDLLLSEGCLEFFEQGLSRFRSDERVMQISAFRHFDKYETEEHASFFLPLALSWGWATWDTAWKHFDPTMAGIEELKRDAKLRRRFDIDGSFPFSLMLEDQMAGRIDSWFIRWYWSIFRRNGLGLFPSKSLICNIGFSQSATHCTTEAPWLKSPDWRQINEVQTFPDNVQIDRNRLSRLTRLFRLNTGADLVSSWRRRIRYGSPRFGDLTDSILGKW